MDARDKVGGRTALLLVVRAAQEQCVRILIESGVDPDLKVGSITPTIVLKEKLPGLWLGGIVVRY